MEPHKGGCWERRVFEEQNCESIVPKATIQYQPLQFIQSTKYHIPYVADALSTCCTTNQRTVVLQEVQNRRFASLSTSEQGPYTCFPTIVRDIVHGKAQTIRSMPLLAAPG